MDQILHLLSSGILGIFLGAQLAEAKLLVPYWKTLSADDFFELHETYGTKIHSFFAPLTIAATAIPLLTVGLTFLHQSESLILYVILGIATLAFFSTYFLYFKTANGKFTARSISNEELPGELYKWEIWHWGRIWFECLAFGCSLLLLVNYS